MNKCFHGSENNNSNSCNLEQTKKILTLEDQADQHTRWIQSYKDGNHQRVEMILLVP